MKKNIVRILALVLMASLIFGTLLTTTGCKKRKKIFVFNCGDYIAPEVIDLFEEEFPQYELVYDTFDTNETMYQKLVSTNIPYDVIIPSDYMIERLIVEERLKEIDYSKVPNYALIRDSLKGTSFDPDEKYTVPYMWGTLGIVYNKKLVKGEITSWNVLWDPQYKGQILMLDSMRDAMALSLFRLGYDQNTHNADEVKKAGEELRKQKALVKQYGVDDIKAPMIQGHYALCVEWSGDALWMMQQNPDLGYCIPEEGSNRWIDAMVIPTSSQNYEGALDFINFMCSTEIAYLNAEYIAYSTPQDEVLELLRDHEDFADYIDDPVYNPTEEELSNCTTFRHLDEDTLKLYNKTWEELRLSPSADGDDGLITLVIVYAAIILVCIALVIIFRIRKKKLDEIKYGTV